MPFERQQSQSEKQQSRQPQQSSSGQGRELSRSGQGGGLSRRGGGYDPFSFSPAEFFQNPFSLMRRMHDEMDRVFADTFGGAQRDSGEGGAVWAPAIEINQSDNQLKICAELPGLKQEDVQVEVIEDNLVIQGERKHEQEYEEGGVRRSERRYGRFYRAIPLPEGAQVENAQADFRDGVLEVTVPVQQPESKRRQIKIGSGQGDGRTIESGHQSSLQSRSHGDGQSQQARAAAASSGQSQSGTSSGGGKPAGSEEHSSSQTPEGAKTGTPTGSGTYADVGSNEAQDREKS